MDGDSEPKIETEAEGRQQVDDVSKQRQNSNNDAEDSAEKSQNQQDEVEEDQEEVSNSNNEINDNTGATPEDNEANESGEGHDPMDASPESEEESQVKRPIGANDGEDEDDENYSGRQAQDSPQHDDSPGANEVYDRHQIDGGQYEAEGEQEGEEFEYVDEEEKNLEYDDEETKRLYEDENEEDIRQQMEQEQYMEEEEEEEEDPIQKKIRAIIELCEQTNGMYGDSDFPPNDASLYKNPAEPPDYAASTPVVEWMRPEEALKNEDPSKIAMIIDGATPGDVEQGALGDCWLLSALMVLSVREELLQNLIVKDCINYGFAVFQFFKNGEWKQVLVDTRIPYNRETKLPLYARCKNNLEVWLPLIEKAYAKLHGCYEALNGGSLVEALVDLTGGVSEKFSLEAPDTIQMRDNGQLWKELRKYYQAGYLLGCAKNVRDENGEQEERVDTQGILCNHAYGIMEVRVALGIQLIRIRNPWGQGEWNGRYADEDEAWDDSKGLKEELNYEFGDDGTWWMRYDDWYANFNKLYVCKIFPSTWQQYSITSEWEGNTAGGPYPPMIDRDEATGEHTQLDTNDKWFNNPQFRVSVAKKTQVYISLMQEDEKVSRKPYIPVNFLVVRVHSKKQRLWEVDKDDVVIEAAKGMQRFGQREICVTCWLYPTYEKKPVHYIIIPNTEVESKKDEERPFFLRIFTSEKVDLVELPKTIEQQFMGKWIESTAGGSKTLPNGSENKYWCRNPQYFLNLKKPTHLKIILRKKGGKKLKGIPIGLCVTKAHPPTAPPAAKIKKDGVEMNPSKTGAHGNLANSKLTRGARTGFKTTSIAARRNFKEDNFPEIVPPELENLERKLQILPNEWYIESQYKSEDVAAIYAFWKPTKGPFLIVPSLAQAGYAADYTLTVFSSNPVEIEKLEDSRNMVMSGEWNEKSAGGCHLYDRAFETIPDNFTWINNPKFLLKLFTTTKTEVKITLSRPEKAWKKKIAVSAVDCMIGFYVFPGNITPTKENCITTNFVPMNELSETLELDGNPEGYIIMPTTYKPKLKGPFIISVATDVEFTLENAD